MPIELSSHVHVVVKYLSLSQVTFQRKTLNRAYFEIHEPLLSVILPSKVAVYCGRNIILPMYFDID